MNTDNFYYKIYQKKQSKELLGVIENSNSDIDTKLTALEILKERDELTDELIKIQDELKQKIKTVSTKNIAQNKYQTFWRRFFAMWIDGIIIGLLGYLMKFYQNSESIVLFNLILFLSQVLPYMYSILLHGTYGQTFGKMITGVRIFDKSENTNITFGQAVLRDIFPLGGVILLFLLSWFGLLTNGSFATTITIIIMAIMLLWTILEIVTMLFSEKRRALHDLIAGTVVLRLRE
jgi:uncharacterized RDD family membrane protein YckC